MNTQGPPPPPPPPHGSHNQQHHQHQHQQAPPPPPPPPRNPNLPPGNYDIFVIPPHSSGSGFLYLPSMQVNRNSFIAGSVCTLAALGLWILVEPVLKQWASTVFANGGSGMILLILGVAVLGWAAGKTQMENSSGRPGGPGGPKETGGNSSTNYGSDHAYASGAHGAHAHTGSDGGGGGGGASGVPPFGAAGAGAGAGTNAGPGFGTGTMPGGGGGGAGTNPKSSWQRTNPSAGWEKAREEMRKKEEERKKREEADKKAKEAAEKQKWEQSRQREREQREKEARERVAQERLKRERELKEQREKQEREAREKERAAAAAAAAKEKERQQQQQQQQQQQSQHSSNYKKPTASSFVSEEQRSYRPYDKKPKQTGSQSSFMSGSETSASWTTGSQSTARTTPPPSHRGPYVNKDPDKVTLRAAFWFTDTLPGKPLAQLISGVGSVTDGLVLKMTTEGLFIDDDVRGVPQREWDIKAWTMKLVESGDLRNRHILRASIRDAENKKFVFIIDESEAWKVAVGLQRLRRGSQVRSLGVSGMSVSEMTGLLKLVGG